MKKIKKIITTTDTIYYAEAKLGALPKLSIHFYNYWLTSTNLLLKKLNIFTFDISIHIKKKQFVLYFLLIPG